MPFAQAKGIATTLIRIGTPRADEDPRTVTQAKIRIGLLLKGQTTDLPPKTEVA